MIRIAVVDDERIQVEQMLSYLKRYEEEQKEELRITIYRDGDGILAGYNAQFDIILMDIQMKFINGMAAAEEIRKLDSEVIIIFITNMTQYAIRGYEVDALDYVLKPITYFAFSQKLGRAVSRMKRRSKTYISVFVKGGVSRFSVEDIYYVESAGHNLVYHTISGNHVTSGTMKDAEEKLGALGFCRGNKCYLINLAHVDKIHDKCAIVKGNSLQISRPKFHVFMQELTKYWGSA